MRDFESFLVSLLDEEVYDAALEILNHVRDNPDINHYLADAAREILNTPVNPAKFETLIFGLGVSYQRWVVVNHLRTA